jgi:alkaline phosphatase
MLKKNEEKGFFLMVEGAKIDMGHHDGKVRDPKSNLVQSNKTFRLLIRRLTPLT